MQETGVALKYLPAIESGADTAVGIYRKVQPRTEALSWISEETARMFFTSQIIEMGLGIIFLVIHHPYRILSCEIGHLRYPRLLGRFYPQAIRSGDRRRNRNPERKV